MRRLSLLLLLAALPAVVAAQSLPGLPSSGAGIGPAGAAGQTGPAGPTGATGATGPAGAAGALTQISQQVLGSSAPTITFNSIPGTYTDLVLVVTGRGDATAPASSVYLQFNGDTGSNYSGEQLLGNNTSATATPATATAKQQWGVVTAATATSGLAGSSEITIFGYAGTTFQKNALSRINWRTGTTAATFFTLQQSNWWNSTSAITSIVAGLVDGSNFITGSVATLYGR